VPVVTVSEDWSSPGGAANVAANVAAVGATVDLVGVIGDDDGAAVLRDNLQGYGIESHGLIAIPSRPTTTKTRLIARGQQVVRIDREVDNPLADRHRDALVEAAHRALEDADVLMLEDYDKGVLDPALIADLIAAARDGGIPVIADPRERHFNRFAGVTVFKPNRRELSRALRVRMSGDGNDLAEARTQLGVDYLLVTLGAEGMALVGADGVVRRTPGVALEVFDVSGAGDTVTAWVGLALAAEASIEESIWLANLAAAVEVGKQGTGTVSPGELLDAFDRFHSG
jgi:D-beta-D-heptose 7-phosphate kinase/D-beta-D-heptose 1-phosphate adenosyltransferase